MGFTRKVTMHRNKEASRKICFVPLIDKEDYGIGDILYFLLLHIIKFHERNI